jgi:hypothetical protein
MPATITASLAPKLVSSPALVWAAEPHLFAMLRKGLHNSADRAAERSQQQGVVREYLSVKSTATTARSA